MRSQGRRVLSIFLLLMLAGCSKKPSDTASNSTSQNTAAPTNDTSTGTQSTSPTSASTPTPAPVPAPPEPVIVPAGTTLTIKLGEALGSKLSSTGDSFRARLASDVAVDGNAVIPAGTSVRGKVVSAQPLGKLKGGALLEIRLTSITVNETDQSITTSSISRTKKGKGKRTAGMAGGGAAFGAILGGLAGGGKGAAIGAVAGGGAGTAGAAYTGNDDIVLPVESALSFKLRSPLTVNPPQ